MNDRKPDNPDANRRTCDRLSVSRKMLLELDNGGIVIGESEDISLRGVLLRTDSLPESELAGMAGTLYVLGSHGGESSGYPCRVIRVRETSLALELDRKVAAAFGQYVTRDLLRR